VNGSSFSEETYATIKPLTYRTFYELFAKALLGEGEVPVDPEGPAHVIRLIELARQSSKDGKTLDVKLADKLSKFFSSVNLAIINNA
jgi:predicted dehydrogenase